MKYDIHTDIAFDGLQPFDTTAIAEACTVPWWNQSLVRVNDCVVRLGVFHGEFHWHSHVDEDEVFFVLQGTLFLDVEGRGTFELTAGKGITVPRTVVHRTRSPERSVVLMIEGAGVVPTGD